MPVAGLLKELNQFCLFFFPKADNFVFQLRIYSYYLPFDHWSEDKQKPAVLFIFRYTLSLVWHLPGLKWDYFLLIFFVRYERVSASQAQTFGEFFFNAKKTFIYLF